MKDQIIDKEHIELRVSDWKKRIEEVSYYQTNIDWLQSRFPEAKYADVVGLCKVADKTEYAEEQDYSLNSGRYVGIEIEGVELSKEEFNSKIHSSFYHFKELTKSSLLLENEISNKLSEFIL